MCAAPLRAGAVKMQSFAVAIEFVAVAAVVSAIELIVLLFRNPLRPRWLRTSLAESVAVLAIVMGLTFVLATFISGMIGAGLNVFVALVAGVCIPVLVAVVNERLFGIRERLRRADAGQSPFGVKLGVAPGADPAHG